MSKSKTISDLENLHCFLVLEAKMSQSKHIWMYWHQGEKQAPVLVQMCIASWRRQNLGWQVHVLDRHSLDDHVTLSSEIDLSRSDPNAIKISNLARLYLLRRYGGVWADATMFCSEPLDNWLPRYLSTGFFAFRNSSRDRLFSSWFLAADKDNPLLCELHARYRDVFRENRYYLQNMLIGKIFCRLLRLFLKKSLSRSRLWVSWPVRKILRVYPYHHLHYTFNAIIAEGGEPSRIWHAVEPIQAVDILFIKKQKRAADGLERTRQFILERRAPIHKFKWSEDIDTDFWKMVFHSFSVLEDQATDFAVTDASNRPALQR